MDSASYELMAALRRLLESGKYSDLTILCGEKRYAVHRAIICSRSSFFDGACSNAFREAETGTIDLSHDDAEAVDHMVHYCYHLDYLSAPKLRSQYTCRAKAASTTAEERPTSPLTPMTMSPTSPSFGRATKRFKFARVEDPLLATAAFNPTNLQDPLTPPPSSSSSSSSSPSDRMDKDSPPRQELMEDYLPDDFYSLSVAEQEPDLKQPHLVAHAKVYAIAEKYGISGLKALAQKKFASQAVYHWNSPEFPAAMQEAYETTIDTDRGLRDVVIQMFRAFPEIAQRKDVEAVVKETPSLAWELFKVGWGLPI